jgi:hypothetical protein
MRGMSNTHSLILAGLLLATSAPAFADITGVQAGTSGGVHGDVQIAKAEYAPSQRQIGHQIGSGEPIYMGDQIATGTNGGLQVMLLDQTVMTLGQNAKMTVDEMVYDPKSGTGKLNFNVSQGAFRFVSGQIAKANPENVKITTPMATIGIRGTIVGGSVDSGNAIIALLGPGGETNTSARHGAIQVSTPSGTVDISRTGFATIITPGQPPSPPAPATAEQLQRFGQAGAGSNSASTKSLAAASTDQTASGSPAPTSQTSGTGSNASSISGNTLAVGGALSTIITAPPPVTIAANDTTSPALAKTIKDNQPAAAASAAPADTGPWASLDGTSVGYNRAYLYYSDDAPGISDDGINSATLTFTSTSNWTFTDPENGSSTFPYPADSVNLSNWSSTSNDTISSMPVGTKYASATVGSNNYYAYDLTDTAGLTYSKFGIWLGGSNLSWSGNQLASTDPMINATLGAYSFGVATPSASMPSTGFATYTGTFGALGYTPSSIYAVTGQMNWSANFGSNTLNGYTGILSFSTLKGADVGAPFTQLNLYATINGASSSLSGSSITVDNAQLASNTATIKGQFNGPNAEEISGAFKVVGKTSGFNNGSYLIGSFGAARGVISNSPP